MTANEHSSCLYTGTVMHRRFRPRAHRSELSRVLDPDSISTNCHTCRPGCGLFSLEGFNLFGLHNADHGDGSSRPLRQQVEAHLAAADIALDGGAIRLLCMPRLLGFVFNPISVYYCYHRDGALKAMLYEVHNTFGQRHSYLIPVDADAGEPLEQRCLKAFYVSPFMDMDIAYRFRVQPPAERVTLVIEGADAQGPVLDRVARRIAPGADRRRAAARLRLVPADDA